VCVHELCSEHTARRLLHTPVDHSECPSKTIWTILEQTR
jgi:hypothetical protein